MMPSGQPVTLLFGTSTADGGTGVSAFGGDCDQRWHGCEVVITCGSGFYGLSFDLTFDPSRQMLSGPAMGICRCQDAVGTNYKDESCKISGGKT
jgi:hypothetical protein